MTITSREPNKKRIILLRLNTAYALAPHTAIRRKRRVAKMAEAVVGHVDQTIGKKDPLTDNAYSTQNTHDRTDSIPHIATADKKIDVKPNVVKEVIRQVNY